MQKKQISNVSKRQTKTKTMGEIKLAIQWGRIYYAASQTIMKKSTQKKHINAHPNKQLQSHYNSSLKRGGGLV